MPWLKVRREGVELMCAIVYCWMMLRVDGCLNEDPGPLPGPRCLSALAESSSGTFMMCSVLFWMMLELMNVPMKIRGPCQGPDLSIGVSSKFYNYRGGKRVTGYTRSLKCDNSG